MTMPLLGRAPCSQPWASSVVSRTSDRAVPDSAGSGVVLPEDRSKGGLGGVLGWVGPRQGGGRPRRRGGAQAQGPGRTGGGLGGELGQHQLGVHHPGSGGGRGQVGELQVGPGLGRAVGARPQLGEDAVVGGRGVAQDHGVGGRRRPAVGEAGGGVDGDRHDPGPLGQPGRVDADLYGDGRGGGRGRGGRCRRGRGLAQEADLHRGEGGDGHGGVGRPAVGHGPHDPAGAVEELHAALAVARRHAGGQDELVHVGRPPRRRRAAPRGPRCRRG